MRNTLPVKYLFRKTAPPVNSPIISRFIGTITIISLDY